MLADWVEIYSPKIDAICTNFLHKLLKCPKYNSDDVQNLIFLMKLHYSQLEIITDWHILDLIIVCIALFLFYITVLIGLWTFSCVECFILVGNVESYLWNYWFSQNLILISIIFWMCLQFSCCYTIVWSWNSGMEVSFIYCPNMFSIFQISSLSSFSFVYCPNIFSILQISRVWSFY